MQHLLYAWVRCCCLSAVSRDNSWSLKTTRKIGPGEEKEKCRLGTRFSYAASFSSAEVKNLSALVLSFGTVRMALFHSSVTVMRQSSSLKATCASSPPTMCCYQINQPPSALLVMWHRIIMFLLPVIKARSSPSWELLRKKPAALEHQRRGESLSDRHHIEKHV